ncbi:MAG: TRAP transporter small permease [Clostridiales bacterium]|nr:TRAP transporter small permease [Clostridiales bacterium]
METIKRIDDIFAKILKTLTVTFCVTIAIILFIRVIIRFLPFVISLAWTDEIVEWMMAWMIFTAATVITRDGGHFRVDLIESKLKGNAKHFLNMAISLIGLSFVVILFYYSLKLTLSTTQFSPILKLPTSVFYLCMPLNSFLIGVYTVRDIVRSALSIYRGRS